MRQAQNNHGQNSQQYLQKNGIIFNEAKEINFSAAGEIL